MFALCVCVGGGDDPVFCSVCLSFPGHGRLRSLGGGKTHWTSLRFVKMFHLSSKSFLDFKFHEGNIFMKLKVQLFSVPLVP